MKRDRVMSGRAFRRRFAALVLLALLPAGLSADEGILIDFSRLAADTDAAGARENEATLVALDTVESNAPDAEPKRLHASLAPGSWIVLFMPSGKAAPAGAVREASVEAAGLPGGSAGGGPVSVMEIRIDFSAAPAGTTGALVLPPFEIPFFADKTRFSAGTLIAAEGEQGRNGKFLGAGRLDNAGPLKRVSVVMAGAPDTGGELGLALRDNDGAATIYYFGGFGFDGWYRLEYGNPDYLRQIRERELIWPEALVGAPVPSLRFLCFLVSPPADDPRRTVVLRVKEIGLVYDRARFDR